MPDSQDMADHDVLTNQKQILDNQKTILDNQTTIQRNQEAIQKNQQALDVILKNQASIVANQEKILSLLEKKEKCSGGIVRRSGRCRPSLALDNRTQWPPVDVAKRHRPVIALQH